MLAISFWNSGDTREVKDQAFHGWVVAFKEPNIFLLQVWFSVIANCTIVFWQGSKKVRVENAHYGIQGNVISRNEVIHVAWHY